MGPVGVGSRDSRLVVVGPFTDALAGLLGLLITGPNFMACYWALQLLGPINGSQNG